MPYLNAAEKTFRALCVPAHDDPRADTLRPHLRLFCIVCDSRDKFASFEFSVRIISEPGPAPLQLQVDTCVR